MENVNFVNIVNGKQVKTASQKLADLIMIALLPSSASAQVSGEQRAQASNALKGILPQLGKFTGIVIDTDERTVTLNADNLPSVLDAVVSAVSKNEAYRESIAKENDLYSAVREEVDKNPSNGKRGRKASDPALKYAVSEADMFV